MIMKKFLPLLPVLLLAGCSTTATFTRMTPSQQPRNTDNLYPVEVAFNSQQQSIRWDSIQPHVLVSGQSFPLRPVPVVKNRWEGLLPRRIIFCMGSNGSYPCNISRLHSSSHGVF